MKISKFHRLIENDKPGYWIKISEAQYKRISTALGEKCGGYEKEEDGEYKKYLKLLFKWDAIKDKKR